MELSAISIFLSAILAFILLGFRTRIRNRIKIPAHAPVSVNYHFTRTCNYDCGFCFHTSKTSYRAPLEDAKEALTLLRDAGMRKINFAGGEPFLHPKHLGTLVKFCKSNLNLESVSIVTNGSLVRMPWIEEYGPWLDILAVSCDSFDEATNIKIGRGKGNHLESFKELRKWCDKFHIKFKVNTVVNRFNIDEDMSGPLKEISPFRWKAFQVLIVPGENDSEATIRDARKFTITGEEFKVWCERHKDVKSLVPENNTLMRSSYLILDEYLRFLDHKRGQPGKPILEVGVEKAMKEVFWDEESFHARGGIYDWARKAKKEDCGPLHW